MKFTGHVHDRAKKLLNDITNLQIQLRVLQHRIDVLEGVALAQDELNTINIDRVNTIEEILVNNMAEGEADE
jgi:hypothetical protein